MFKGAIHIHSTHSDGEFTLPELRSIYREAGCRFAMVTDHANYFDEDKVSAYREECARLSDAEFIFIPGLEFGCWERMHILGYGVTALTATENPQEVIEHITRAGGISVIAHPKNEMFETIENFDVLPQGIETWNSKYDGRYAPRPGTFQLLHRLQKRAERMHAFYGQDLHWRKQYRNLFNHVECDELKIENVLAAFAEGRYVGVKDDLELSASGAVSEELLARFSSVHERSSRMRDFIKRAKKTADSCGISVPEKLKAQVRRIF